ncbi:MAG: hypothetical protein AB7G47_19585 [Mycolicibacterium sp.]
MRVLIIEADDAQPTELDRAALYVEEAAGHIAAANRPGPVNDTHCT